MQKAALAGAIVLTLAGCDMKPADSPEVTSCEGRILSNLASPSSYKRISVDVSDSQLLDAAIFRAYTGIDPRISVPKQARLRIVYLEYDASNHYGAIIRDKELCYFTITEQQHVDARPAPIEVPLEKPQPVIPDDPSSIVLPAEHNCCLNDALLLQANGAE